MVSEYGLYVYLCANNRVVWKIWVEYYVRRTKFIGIDRDIIPTVVYLPITVNIAFDSTYSHMENTETKRN